MLNKDAAEEPRWATGGRALNLAAQRDKSRGCWWEGRCHAASIFIPYVWSQRRAALIIIATWSSKTYERWRRGAEDELQRLLPALQHPYICGRHTRVAQRCLHVYVCHHRNVEATVPSEAPTTGVGPNAARVEACHGDVSRATCAPYANASHFICSAAYLNRRLCERKRCITPYTHALWVKGVVSAVVPKNLKKANNMFPGFTHSSPTPSATCQTPATQHYEHLWIRRHKSFCISQNNTFLSQGSTLCTRPGNLRP